MDSEINETTKPLIQIDNLVREMTDEEYAVWLNEPPAPEPLA